LCFFHGILNERSYLVCYDNQVDEIVSQAKIDYPLKQMVVWKSDTIYFISVIDQLGRIKKKHVFRLILISIK
jgi:hypothetical protein